MSKGWGPRGTAATALIALAGPVFEPLGALLTWGWLRASRTPWNALGLARSRNWFMTVTLGIVTGGMLKLAMKSLVMPLFPAPAINPVYHFLQGNTAALSLPGEDGAEEDGEEFAEESSINGEPESQ